MSEQLQWRKRGASPTEAEEASLAWAGPFEGAEYTVYAWKGGWAFNRPKHPILGDLDGRVESLDEAKAICQADYEKQQRLRAWHQYMIDNDPPGGVS